MWKMLQELFFQILKIKKNPTPAEELMVVCHLGNLIIGWVIEFRRQHPLLVLSRFLLSSIKISP
jgi:hypothetical protein